jgi:hypothetical protein
VHLLRATQFDRAIRRRSSKSKSMSEIMSLLSSSDRSTLVQLVDSESILLICWTRISRREMFHEQSCAGTTESSHLHATPSIACCVMKSVLAINCFIVQESREPAQLNSVPAVHVLIWPTLVKSRMPCGAQSRVRRSQHVDEGVVKNKKDDHSQH